MDASNKQITRRGCLTLLAGAMAGAAAPGYCWSETARLLLRVAVSTETLAGANIRDARTAYRLWIDQFGRESGHVIAQVVPEVFIPSEELIRDVRQGTVDCFAVTAPEFAKLIDTADPNILVLQDYLADGMEYVLLVHNSSPYKKIGDLRGAQILSHRHRDMVLLPAWLDTMLAAANLPLADRFFGSNTLRDKVNEVVLPIFFRRAEAACLARRSWETALELNPQLGRDLRPFAMSPKIIPIAIGFRRNCNPEGLNLLVSSMTHISTTPAGQQMAAMYQSRAFVVRPTSVMKTSVDMVNQFDRLFSQAAVRRGKS